MDMAWYLHKFTATNPRTPHACDYCGRVEDYYWHKEAADATTEPETRDYCSDGDPGALLELGDRLTRSLKTE